MWLRIAAPLCLLLAAPRASAVDPALATQLEKYLAGSFGEKIVGTAVSDGMKRIFRGREDAANQAREAFEAALASQTTKALLLLGDLAEGLSNKDKAASMTASKKLAELLASKAGYWDSVIEKILPDVANRLRPLVRALLPTLYHCDARFLGVALGMGDQPKTAAQKARALKHSERLDLCQRVRRWMENHALSKVDDFMVQLARDLKGEPIQLGKQGEETAAMIKKLLERELIVFVGQYRENMERIRSALERVADQFFSKG